MVHHEEHIGSDISLSNLERSTDQVVQPIYKSGTTVNFIVLRLFIALSSWEGVIKDKDLDVVEDHAPLMKVFGYKPEVHHGEYNQFKSDNQSDDFKKTFPHRI